jgi:hypothetical protein
LVYHCKALFGNTLYISFLAVVLSSLVGNVVVMQKKGYTSNYSKKKVKENKESYLRNRPWRPIGL